MATRYRLYKTLHKTSVDHEPPKPQLGDNGYILVEYDVVPPTPTSNFKYVDSIKGGVIITWLDTVETEAT